MAAHPGDIVRARNGKTIMIEDTDNEGRVILADTLSYAQTYHPCLVIDVATLTREWKTDFQKHSTTSEHG